MADLVFAFDAALDRPIPVPPGAPAAVVEVVATAPWEALQVAVSTARQARAAALVLFGSTLDPLRASPAQAAQLRRQQVDGRGLADQHVGHVLGHAFEMRQPDFQRGQAVFATAHH